MTTFHTNNPIGSTSPKDLFDNSENLDVAVNDLTSRTWEDRFGRQRATVHAIESSVPDAIAARDAAESAADRAQNAAEIAIVGSNIYPNEPAGRASVADGQTFSVEGAGDFAAYIYRRNDALSSTLIAIIPSADFVARADYQASFAYEMAPYRSLSDWPWAVTDEALVPIIGVKPSGFAHVVTDELPGVDMLDHRYRYAVVDEETGDVVHAYTWDGGIALGGSRILDHEFAFVFATEAGKVLFGLRWDGTFFPSSQDSGNVVAYADGDPGRRSIWVQTDAGPAQITSSGDAWAPQISGSDTVKYLTRRNGGVVSESARFEGKYGPFVTRIIQILSNGQSLSVGGDNIISTRPAAINRALTARVGVRGSNTATPLAPSDIVPFGALVSNHDREPPVVGMSFALSQENMLPADAATMTTVHGSGGKKVDALAKGSAYYANSIAVVSAAKAQCVADGLGYSVGFVDWIQGEASRNDSIEFYSSEMLQLQSDYTADITAITGQPGQVPILLDQISNWTAYGNTTSFVPLAQLQLALEHPDKFVCAGPKYWLDTVPDGIHVAGENSVLIGRMHAIPAQELLAGRPWLPVHCTSAVRSGNIVRLAFHVPAGKGILIADTNLVSDPGNLGIRWIDDSSSATIKSITVNADNSIVVELSNTPTGANQKIGIADIGIAGNRGGPHTGARSCLRASNPSKFSSGGGDVYHWVCHQRINVTL